MNNERCSCGFAEVGDETIGDHFIEVFASNDGKGPDGKVHLEGKASLFCVCGAGGSAGELDAHFLAVFTPGAYSFTLFRSACWLKAGRPSR